MKSSRWNDELVEELKKLYFKKELTTIEIGKKLGFTKNAIIGKIHRLELSSNMSENAKMPDSKSKRSENTHGQDEINEIYGIAVKTAVIKKPMGKYLLEDLEFNMCTWPFGGDENTAEITFCGNIKAQRSSYCQAHLDNAYLAPKKQVRKTNLETFTEEDIVEEDEEEHDSE